MAFSPIYLINFAKNTLWEYLTSLEKKTAKTDTIESIPAIPEIDKITIHTLKPTVAKSYVSEIDNVRSYFGKLYKKAIKGTESRYKYNNLLLLAIPNKSQKINLILKQWPSIQRIMKR